MGKKAHFGEHLTIDGYEGNYAKLADEKLIRKVLNDLPTMLGMKKISEPVVCDAPSTCGKDCGGWSGFVIIAESHITIHTFPKKRFLTADVYTCKNNLDVKLVEDYFKEKFEIKNIEKNLIIRGTKYPIGNIC
jgi:S-adenosylmethionine decarboxylase